MDDKLNVTLRISQWRVVAAHVEIEVYGDMPQILASLHAQLDPGVIAAMVREAAELAAIRAEQHAPSAAKQPASPPVPLH